MSNYIICSSTALKLEKNATNNNLEAVHFSVYHSFQILGFYHYSQQSKQNLVEKWLCWVLGDVWASVPVIQGHLASHRQSHSMLTVLIHGYWRREMLNTGSLTSTQKNYFLTANIEMPHLKSNSVCSQSKWNRGMKCILFIMSWDWT